LHSIAQSAVTGADLETILRNSALSTSADQAFEFVGHELYDNPAYKGLTLPPKTITHAMVGGVFAELGNGDFTSGAIATAASHLAAEQVKSEMLARLESGESGVDLNDTSALLEYATQIERTTRALSIVVAGSAAIISGADITQEELDAALNVSSSVVENNVLCGGLCIGAAVLATAAYTTWVGDGDFVDGLEVIGEGDHPVGRAIDSTTAKAVEMSYENFPEATQSTLDVLSKVGDGVSYTVKLADDVTGNITSDSWHTLDKDTQVGLIGAGKVVSIFIPAASTKLLKELNNKHVSGGQRVDSVTETDNTAIVNVGEEAVPDTNLNTPITDPNRLLANPARDSRTGEIDSDHRAPEDPRQPIESFPAPEGTRIEMAVSPGQIDPVTGQVDSPGGFGSQDRIESAAQVRNDLAVKEEFKDQVTHVQEFEVRTGTQIQPSTVGPQVNPDGTVISGGGSQVEILVPRAERNNVLTPVGEARLLPDAEQ